MKRLTPEEEMRLLTECIKKGNCESLITRYWNYVYFAVRETLRICGIRDSVANLEDYRNTVFVRLLENDRRRLRKYEPEAGLRLTGWIKLISVRTVLNELRKKGFDTPNADRRRLDLPEDFFSGDAHIPTPPESRRWGTILEAMARLSPRDRLVLKLCFFHGLSVPEVANALRQTTGATYTIKSRALKNLRQAIKNEKKV